MGIPLIRYSQALCNKPLVAKLAVTTPPRYGPGRGPVQVETVCGGVGVSTITFAFVETEIALVPEVTGVSPREGPVEGGQRVILRGSNLGECKEDVVRVVIADVDCTETLEYFSPGTKRDTCIGLNTKVQREIPVPPCLLVYSSHSDTTQGNFSVINLMRGNTDTSRLN